MNRLIGIIQMLTRGMIMEPKQQEPDDSKRDDSVARSEVLRAVSKEKERPTARRGFLRKAAVSAASAVGLAGVFSGTASACKAASGVCIDGQCKDVECCVRYNECYTYDSNQCGNGCGSGEGPANCRQFCFG